MGKSRKRKNVDRNARRDFVVGPPGMAIDRGRPPAIRPSLPAFSKLSEAALAIPLPPSDEPAILRRSPIELPPRTQSKYPAKKTKRIKWVEPNPAPCHQSDSPTSAPFKVTSPLPMVVPVEAARAPESLLLLTYQPLAAPEFEAELTLDLELVAGFAASAFDEIDLMLALDAQHAPQPVKVAKPPVETLLPRHTAVTAWKKRGPLDAIGYWLRRRTRTLWVMLVPSGNGTELAALRRENEALRRKLRAFEAMAG